MRELLEAFPELPLLALVAAAAVVSRQIRRYVAGILIGLVLAVALGVVARQALAPEIGICRSGATVALISRSAR